MDFYWFTNGPGSDAALYHSELDWNRDLVTELGSREVGVVLDAGANSGQYATGLRRADFQRRIISFEPLSGPFAILERASAGDPLWDCHRCALGDRDGNVSMNVAGGTAECSSVLPMMQIHRDLVPHADYVGVEEVPINRLDAVASRVLEPNEVAFLKLDVQGFEKQVLAGAESTVRDHCVGLQLELSFVPVYDGGMLIQEALELVRSLGFTLTGFVPFFFDMRSGSLLQADGVFFRA